jgi:hypothetical protein
MLCHLGEVCGKLTVFVEERAIGLTGSCPLLEPAFSRPEHATESVKRPESKLPAHKCLNEISIVAVSSLCSYGSVDAAQWWVVEFYGEVKRKLQNTVK